MGVEDMVSSGCFLLSWLFLVVTWAGRALSAELPGNRILVTDEYLTPNKKTSLEVECLAEGLPVDLSGIEVEWTDASDKIGFSEQSGGKVFATPTHYEGLAFDITYVEARILLNGRNVTLETRVVILRPWGEQPTLSDRMNDTDAEVEPRLCIVYPAKTYFLREFWIDLNWEAYYPSPDEQFWKGERLELQIPEGEPFPDNEIRESGRALPGAREIHLEFSPWDRSKVDFFYSARISVSSNECIVEAQLIDDYYTPEYWNCSKPYMRYLLQYFMASMSRATFSSYGALKLRSHLDFRYNTVEWVFDVTARPPTSTPDPSCYEQY